MQTRIPIGAALLLLGWTATGSAWWVKGHQAITEAAAMRLPDEMPAFFRAAGKQFGHLAGDPDRWKNPDAKHLRAAESPDHFLDLEDLAGNELPEDRHRAASLIAGKLRKRPERVGMLPYALMEHYDRLSVAFYDYRQIAELERKVRTKEKTLTEAELKALEADKKAIEMKCIVYAGALAHYTGDTAMPLHATVHYDGRPGPDGKLVQKGIHAKIDGFPENHGFTAEEISRGVEAKEIENVWKHVMALIHDSNKHVDRCYELDKAGGFDNPTEQSKTFIMDRCRVGAQFTVDLWYTAWKRSAKLPPHY